MVTGTFTISVESKRHPAIRIASLTICAMQDMSVHRTKLRSPAIKIERYSSMMQSFEEAGAFGKDFMDTGLKSFASVSQNMQAIAVEATEYSKKAFEAGSAAAEKLVSAKSLDKAFEIQTDYAKQAYEGFVAQATRMGELYAEMARDAYKPFESTVAKAK